MSSVILWSLEDSDTDSKDRFKEIVNWWTGLEGRSVKYRRISGIETNPSTGEERELFSLEESFTIQNPRLEDATLSFEKKGRSHNIPVQQLKLDVVHNQLKVFSYAPDRHIFTQIPAPGMGFFRRETIRF